MRWNDTKCIPEEMKYVFPNVYEYTNDSTHNESGRVNKFFQLTVYNKCLESRCYVVPIGHQYDYKIFANGSFYVPYYVTLFKSASYCLGVILERGRRFEAIFSSEQYAELKRNALKYTPEYSWITRVLNIYSSLLLVCILFLVAVFLVYSILPGLRNEHGFMLRNYSAVTSIALMIDIVRLSNMKEDVSYPVCITIAFLGYFCLISGYFWLSIMSFNMWRTFRRFTLLQRNSRQSEKKKLVYYAIFAYGCPFVLAIICVIVVDYVSEYIPIILRPEFKKGYCWYFTERFEAFMLYYYSIKTVCVISSICLSIFTARNIKHFERDTNFSLTDSESKQFNDNKRWLNLYIKLFIVFFIIMGINWIMYIISRLLFTTQLYKYSYYTEIVSALLGVVQNFFMFIIFVWKKKNKLMLLKRFGFKTNASTNTSNITLEVSMQEMSNSCGEENCHTKDSSNGIEF
ncbi:G-protein coupled receptor Mth2-like [Nylanderia fulva]|uniref:G-protein coupled receptor Mth2-like n=1 Tax=Nylanderia fulva TaxID=613905 RepID=UPI0010FAD9C7|nr:G-protein coupled receptor Mth2-like [Nylanderia fulva]